MRSGLNSLKSEVDRLGVDKLKPVPVDLKKKISDVAANGVVKKIVYDELVKKINAIDTNELVKI